MHRRNSFALMLMAGLGRLGMHFDASPDQHVEMARTITRANFRRGRELPIRSHNAASRPARKSSRTKSAKRRRCVVKRRTHR